MPPDAGRDVRGISARFGVRNYSLPYKAQELLLPCELNWSAQHLISHYGEGDVENVAMTENLLLRRTASYS